MTFYILMRPKKMFRIQSGVEAERMCGIQIEDCVPVMGLMWAVHCRQSDGKDF